MQGDILSNDKLFIPHISRDVSRDRQKGIKGGPAEENMMNMWREIKMLTGRLANRDVDPILDRINVVMKNTSEDPKMSE
jgi:hypothetical protein